MTSAEERCAFSDLLKSQCAHCRPPVLPEKPSPLESVLWGPWFTAGYDGDCDGGFDSQCSGQITEGDTIRADGEGGYLCQSCGTRSL